MEAKYKNNKDKTSVNPDSSFDFKIDYEYLEDSDFEITFKPSDYQWNEIEGNYGAKRQKLIGNLVVSEDPYFVIMFNPSRQWESIQEPYGFNREKLVGQKIKTSGDHLLVEEKVKYTHD